MMNDYGYELASRQYEALTELDGNEDYEPAAFCDACGAPLYPGDDCYRIGSDLFCESCCHSEVV